MVTAQEVFEAAMVLMDELDENGKADTPNTKEYKNRALTFINILQQDLYPYSDTFKQKKSGKRAVPVRIENYDAAIPLDDKICIGVMPYGLASHLLAQEDRDTANFYEQKYMEAKLGLNVGFLAESEDIEDVYGGIEYGSFGRW